MVVYRDKGESNLTKYENNEKRQRKLNKRQEKTIQVEVDKQIDEGLID